MTGVLKGKSSPNKTTAPRYAKFLGISVEELQALGKLEGKAAKAKPTKAEKAAPRKTIAKPAKAAKANQVTLAEAAELAADALAVATHRASAAQRKIIVAVLGAC